MNQPSRPRKLSKLSASDSRPERRQLSVDPILTLLADKQTNRAFSDAHPDSFCLMGVTLEDLYFDRSDLFVAGMAAGVNKVGVFSLYRYQANFVYSEEFWYVHSFDPFHPVDLNLASWQQCVSVSAHSSMNDIEIDIEPLQHAHTAFNSDRTDRHDQCQETEHQQEDIDS